MSNPARFETGAGRDGDLSEECEQRLVRRFFGEAAGFFVEVGANHPPRRVTIVAS